MSCSCRPEQLQITSGTELSHDSIVAKNLNDNCVYFLTERGGAKWCSLAKPDWGRFYTQIGDTFDDHEVFLIEAGSETRMEELMLELRNRFEIIVSNEHCLWPIVPWKATYWKELPRGFRLTVHARGMASPIAEHQGVSTSPWCEYGFKSSACLNLVRPGDTDVNRIEPLRG